MDDSSNSQQTNPSSSYTPSFASGSTKSSSPTTGINLLPPPPPPPPPPSPQDGDATTSSSKRKKPSTDHGEREELQDDADSQINPAHQPESSTGEEDAGTNSNGDEDGIDRGKLEDIDLLNDIFEFYKKTGRYPYDHVKDLNEFHKNWIEKRNRVYENEDEVKEKMEELHERFLNNLVKTRNGEVLEDLMDPIEVEIYLLSYRIWVFEEDDDNGGRDSPKDEKMSKDSSDQQETGDQDDSKDSSDQQEQETGDQDESKDLSSKDSKDSLSKDSQDPSSKDSKDSQHSFSKDSFSKDSASKDSKE